MRGMRRPHAGSNLRENSLAYDDLRDWIRTLEKNGELKRIREEVSPELEMTEITDRVSKIGLGVRDRRAEGPGSTEGQSMLPAGAGVAV